MSENAKTRTTWMEDPNEIIVLANKSQHNYILELPTGRYRLDAGRRMRTLRSILKIGQVEQLVKEGMLSVEK